MRLNTSWAFAGNAVYAGCQWMVFVLLVKSLPLSEVGAFAFGIAVTGPIFVLANVRLRSLLATGVTSPHGFSDYLAARLLTTSAAVGVSLFAGTMVSGVESLVVVGLIACAKACDAVSDICHGLFQRELDMRSAAFGLITNGVLSVVLVGVNLALWSSLVAATAGYAAGSCLALVAWDLPRTAKLAHARFRDVTLPGALDAARCLIWRAFPLGLSAAIGSVQTNVPRYVVAAHLGPPALAIFAALAYIPTLGNLIVNAIGQAALPVLARDLRTSPALYRTRLFRLMKAGIAIGCASVLCTALAGRPVLAWLYSAAYADQIGVLVWLMAAAAVTYSFNSLGTAATVRSRFRAQALISSAGLVVVACSVVPLVTRYGLVGAACALLAGALVEGCAYMILTVRDLRIDRPLAGVVPGALAEGVRS